MQNKTLRLSVIAFLLVSVFILTGTAGYKKHGGPYPSVQKYIENPAVENFLTVHHFMSSATAKSLHCQCEGSSPVATFIWQNDDGSTANVNGGTTACDAEEEDLTLTGDVTFESGDDLDLIISIISGTVTNCTFSLYFY